MRAVERLTRVQRTLGSGANPFGSGDLPSGHAAGSSSADCAKVSAREREQMLEKMWFIAVGMATLVHAGQLRDATTHGIMAALLEAGSVIIPDALRRVGAGRRK